MFRTYINERINLHLRIKNPDELDEATHYFTTLLQAVAWHSTPLTPQTKPANNTPSIYEKSSPKKEGHVADGSARGTKVTESRITDLRDNYKTRDGTLPILPSSTISPLSQRATTP
jgi:hypothetical protein